MVAGQIGALVNWSKRDLRSCTLNGASRDGKFDKIVRLSRWQNSAMQAQILIFVFPAITLILSALFAALWWPDKSKRHVLAYSFGFASMAAGVILNIFLLGGIGPLGILSYHIMSMAGLIAIMWATSVRLGQRLPLIAYCGTVIITSGLLWVTSATGERQAMMIAQNLNSALLLALTAQNLWYSGARHMVDRLIIWTFCGFALFGFTRPFLTIYSEQVFGAGEQGAAMLMSFHVLVLCLLMVVLGLSLAASILLDKQAADKVLATQDALTSLPNRGAFEGLAKKALDRATDERVSASLIVADIDHFKRINDTFGHHVGDKVIADFGRLIASRVRPRDAAGRIGGEEFCVLAWNCDEEGAVALAERLRLAFLAARHEGLPIDEVTSASFGVAEFSWGADYSKTFERADAALYAAKRAGRNRVVGEKTSNVARQSEYSDAGAPNPDNTSAEIVSFAERKAR